MKVNKTIFSITIFMVIAIFLSGCFLPQPTKGIISGQVMMPPTASGLSRDVSGWVPVAGAEVTVVDANGDTHTVYTDEDGYYNFENIAVNPNTVVNATVEVNGNTVVLKAVIPDAVAEDENYDAGTMDPESTALALIVEELIDEGEDPEDIDLDEIKDSDYFEDLVEQITTIIEEGSDVTDDSDVDDSVGNITDEYNATTTELEAISLYGTPLVGERLSITILPSGATASAQWQRASTESGSFTNISGATGASYTLKAADDGKWIRITATGTGDYTGTVTSDAKGPVEFPATLSSVEPDDSIVGTPGYTRITQKVEVSEYVDDEEYMALYILEIDGDIEDEPKLWDEEDEEWIGFDDEEDGKYTSGLNDGFDLQTAHEMMAHIQVKITGESVDIKSYIVDVDDEEIKLSNLLEKTIPANPYFPATLSYKESDDTIVGELGYARFAGSIDVNDHVADGDYDAYYIFEITVGNLEEGTLPQYWDGNAWANFDEVGTGKYRFGPASGFDLVTVDDTTTEFQVKIDGESITGKAYLVDASDDTTVLSNVAEETIEKNYHNYEFEVTGLEDEYVVKDELESPSDSDFAGMIPVQLSIAIDTINNTAYEGNVRVAAVGESDLQLWAKDTNGNWWDINEVGWGPLSEGFPIDLDAVTDVYVVPTAAFEKEITMELVDVTGDYGATDDIIKTQNLSITAIEDNLDPELTTVTPSEGTVTLATGDNFIWTVDAYDEYGLKELEIDHSMEDTLPEFSVYANPDNPYGTAEDQAQFVNAGVTVTYDETEQEWVIDFGETVTGKIVDNDGITFYIVITDLAGNEFGTMYGTTEDNTFAYTITQEEQ